MKIAGFQKLVFDKIDNKPTAIIYLAHCNFRCPYCSSKESVVPEIIDEHLPLSEKEILSFLKNRKDWLDSVLITGGEPTIHKDLPKFSRKIKKIGYRIKLETNGSNPGMIKEMVVNGLIDFLAVDIKAPKNKYNKAIGIEGGTLFYLLDKIERTIELAKNSGIDYEFRTTVVPKILSRGDVIKIIHWLKPAKRYVIQKFQPVKTIDNNFEKIEPYSDDFYVSLVRAAAPFFDEVHLR